MGWKSISTSTSWVSSVPPGECRYRALKLATATFRFSIYLSHPVRRYMTCAADIVLARKHTGWHCKVFYSRSSQARRVPAFHIFCSIVNTRYFPGDAAIENTRRSLVVVMFLEALVGTL